jgi:hypothetical protein
MRLFAVWNKNYKLAWVIAPELDDALGMATETKHIGRPTGYRKWKDYTDQPPEDLCPIGRTLFENEERGLVTQFPPNTEWKRAL